MARFYYDFEFHTHEVKAGLFTKRSYHVIEQIQLGMIDEAGNELEIIYNDFDLKAAWANKWLRDNVFVKYYTNTVGGPARDHIPFNFHWFKGYINKFGVGKKAARTLIRQFIFGHYNKKYNDGMSFSDVAINAGVKIEPIELVAWFGDYDHIAFATTFGGMKEYPEHFPQYTVDLQQEFDRVTNLRYKNAIRRAIPTYKKGNEVLSGFNSIEEFREQVKSLSDYPVNKGEHSAVLDAQWNKELDKFIKTL